MIDRITSNNRIVEDGIASPGAGSNTLTLGHIPPSGETTNKCFTRCRRNDLPSMFSKQRTHQTPNYGGMKREGDRLSIDRKKRMRRGSSSVLDVPLEEYQVFSCETSIGFVYFGYSRGLVAKILPFSFLSLHFFIIYLILYIVCSELFPPSL